MLKVKSAGKRGLGYWEEGWGESQDASISPLCRGERARSWGAQGHHLRGFFKIRRSHRRVSVMDRGEIGVSGISQRAQF